MSYVLEGQRWLTSPITWDFAGSTLPGDTATAFSSSISEQDAQATVTAALEDWSRVAGVQFVYAPQDNAGVDIRIGWGTFATSTTGLELGETDYNYFKGDPEILSDARIRLLDPGFSPLKDSGGTLIYSRYNITLLQVALHEIGHALGLAHDPTDENAIMYPYASPHNRVLAAPDIAGMQAIYGAPQTVVVSVGDNQEMLSGSVAGPPSTIFGGSGALDYTGNAGLIVLGTGSARIDDGTVTVFAGAGPLAAADNLRGEFILGTGYSSLTGGAQGSTDIVFGGTAGFTYAGQQEAASVIGGTGRDTITGGAGGGFYSGGASGNNLLTATGIGTVLVGGGNNDVLRAASIGYDYLVAGSGNETLVGAGGGTDRYFLGSGSVQVDLDAGPSILVTGTGTATIIGGSGNSALFGGTGGADLYVEQAGTHMAITGFRLGVDHVGGGPAAITSVGSGMVVRFADGAVMTLNGVSDPGGGGLLV